MTAGAVAAGGGLTLRGAAHDWLAGPVDPRLARDLARITIAIVLILLALAAMVASGSYLAGPVPAEGPAPGLNL